MAAKRREFVTFYYFATGLLLLLCNAQHPASTPNPPTSTSSSDNGTHQVINKDTHKVTRKVTHLRVKVLLEDPFVMTKDNRQFEGMFVDLLDELTRRANLTYSIVAQWDQSYGYEYAPGNWTGLVGSVQTGEADLAVAPLTIVSKREKVVDFTLPVMTAGLRILYKAPDPWSGGDESFGILLSAFTPGLWVMLLLMFLGVSLLFYVIGRFSPYEDHAFVGKAATYEGLTLLNSFLYAFTSMTFQGYTAAPRSMSGRFLAAFWWMFVILVIAAYSAALCAIFLAFKPSIYRVPFATFDELSKQSDVAYGVVKDGSTQWYLSNSQRPLQKRLWAHIHLRSEHVLVNSVREGMLRVQKSNGKFAFIMEGPMAEYLSEQPPCELMTMGEELGDNAYGFACAKDTNLPSTLNPVILQLHEEDFIHGLKQKWLHKGCRRDDTSEYIYQGLAYFDTFGTEPKYLSDRSVTLRRFSTGFLLLFIGVCISSFILLAEIFYARQRGTAVPQRMPQGGLEDQERMDRDFRDEVA
ncbi:hypothetical protein ACOMHN_020168 [Nucella lapillus]